MPWWVIPEGLAGQLVGAFSLQGPALHVYTVKQATSKPPGAVAGPYSSQPDAQAKADTLNQQNTGTVQHVATAAASDALSVVPNLGTWLVRVAQIALGLVLVAVGVAKMTNAVPVATKIAKTAGTAAVLA